VHDAPFSRTFRPWSIGRFRRRSRSRPGRRAKGALTDAADTHCVDTASHKPRSATHRERASAPQRTFCRNNPGALKSVGRKPAGVMLLRINGAWDGTGLSDRESGAWIELTSSGDALRISFEAPFMADPPPEAPTSKPLMGLWDYEGFDPRLRPHRRRAVDLADDPIPKPHWSRSAPSARRRADFDHALRSSFGGRYSSCSLRARRSMSMASRSCPTSN
jgi:hypothetical protein